MAGTRPGGSYDAAYVTARLAEAGMTLRALPATGAYPAGYRAFWPEIAGAQVPESWEPPPTPRRVSEMDEALGWLALIPAAELKIRKLVGLRALHFRHPRTGDAEPVFTWTRLGEAMGCSDMTAKAWHKRGVEMIVRRLNSPGLCQILAARDARMVAEGALRHARERLTEMGQARPAARRVGQYA